MATSTTPITGFETPYSIIRLVFVNGVVDDIYFRFPAFQQAIYKMHVIDPDDKFFCQRLTEKLSLAGFPATAVSFISYFFNELLRPQFVNPKPEAIVRAWRNEHEGPEFLVDIGHAGHQAGAVTFSELFFTGMRSNFI